MLLHFQRDLESIHRRLLAMSGTVERMIDKATRALVHQIRRAGTVHRADDAAFRRAYDDIVRRRGAQRERLRRI